MQCICSDGVMLLESRHSIIVKVFDVDVRLLEAVKSVLERFLEGND